MCFRMHDSVIVRLYKRLIIQKKRDRARARSIQSLLTKRDRKLPQSAMIVPHCRVADSHSPAHKINNNFFGITLWEAGHRLVHHRADVPCLSPSLSLLIPAQVCCLLRRDSDLQVDLKSTGSPQRWPCTHSRCIALRSDSANHYADGSVWRRRRSLLYK